MAFADSAWNYWSATIGSLIAAIIILSILAIYTFNSIKLNKTTSSQKSYIYLQIVTTLTLLLLSVTTVANIVSYLLIIPYTICQTYLYVVYMVYGGYKGGLYIIYVARLSIVYKGSTFELNKCTNRILWLICGQYFIVWSLGNAWEMFEKKTYTYIEKYGICSFNGGLYGIIYFGLMEIIFPLFCLGLFIKPLIQLGKTHVDDTLFRLCFKYTIITGSAVITSILSILIAVIFGVWVSVPMDYIVNAICIICYDKKYQSIYDKTCKRCETIFAMHRKQNKARKDENSKPVSDLNTKTAAVDDVEIVYDEAGQSPGSLESTSPNRNELSITKPVTPNIDEMNQETGNAKGRRVRSVSNSSVSNSSVP